MNDDQTRGPRPKWASLPRTSFEKSDRASSSGDASLGERVDRAPSARDEDDDRVASSEGAADRIDDTPSAWGEDDRGASSSEAADRVDHHTPSARGVDDDRVASSSEAA
ncbi:MAG: hypothetical protein AAFN74_23380, partial [Myxococcota bacterium]